MFGGIPICLNIMPPASSQCFSLGFSLALQTFAPLISLSPDIQSSVSLAAFKNKLKQQLLA